MTDERRPLPPAAVAELAARYRDRRLAEERLSGYLLGLLNGLGIDPAAMRGFDDTAGVLVLEDPRPVRDPRKGKKLPADQPT